MSLKKVINATGTMLHTNLGRAPLGKDTLDKMLPIIQGYNNLEFDLEKGVRGHRDAHVKSYIKEITGAENSTIVNNNASAVYLILNTLANGKDVIVSRGELVEIGGSFRIPDIMEASGARLIEVGSVNNTTLSDYEDAITENCAMILKVHRSNFKISGDFNDVSISELSKLTSERKLILAYDLGSGLLRVPTGLTLSEISTVKGAVVDGANIISFSGDKLLCGPQAGIIVGDYNLISRCSHAPMMRAMRVGKLTIAALTVVLERFVNDIDYNGSVLENSKTPVDIFYLRAKKLASKIESEIDGSLCKVTVVDSTGSIGGGTLPDYFFKTKAVCLTLAKMSRSEKERMTSKIFHNLLIASTPVVAVLREGEILFDVCTMLDSEISEIALSLVESLKMIK